MTDDKATPKGRGPKVFATLRFMSSDLTPSEVTDVLGVAPTLTQSRQLAPARDPGWFLSTEHSVDSTKLSDHLRFLTEVLAAVPSERLQSLYTRSKIGPSILCFASNPISASIGLGVDDVRLEQDEEAQYLLLGSSFVPH